MIDREQAKRVFLEASAQSWTEDQTIDVIRAIPDPVHEAARAVVEAHDGHKYGVQQRRESISLLRAALADERMPNFPVGPHHPDDGGPSPADGDGCSCRPGVRGLREALEKISGMGAVCGDFMECTHRSCRDSCSAKLTADAALADERVPERADDAFEADCIAADEAEPEVE